MGRVSTARLMTATAAAVLALGVLFPIYWGIRTSFSGRAGGSLLPSEPTLGNYRYIFSNGDFANTVVNSLIVAVGAVIITVPLAVLAAYALARFQFAGKRFGAFLLVLPLLPAVAVLVPLIVYMRSIGIYNTLYAVIIGASLFSLPFVIWMIRGFILSVPAEIEESSYLDGCGRIGALVRVVLPVIAPGMVTAAVFTFITAWNNYILAVAFTTSQKLQVVPVAILGYISAWGTNYQGMDAAATLAMIPPLVFFFLVQRWFVQGILSGSNR